jgi:hypothetical protein
MFIAHLSELNENITLREFVVKLESWLPGK